MDTSRGGAEAASRLEEGWAGAVRSQTPPLSSHRPNMPPVRDVYKYVDVFYKQSHPREEAAVAPIETNGMAGGRERRGACRPASHIAARCAAVEQCELQHELRTLLRPPPPPPPPLSPPRAVPQATHRPRQKEDTRALIDPAMSADSMRTPSEGAVDVDDSDVAECFFDDGAVVLCSAVAHRVNRERAATQQQRRPLVQPPQAQLPKKKKTVAPPRHVNASVSAAARGAEQRRAPQRSPSSTPLERPSTPQPAQHASPSTQTFSQSIPAGYRVLRAPSPSYLYPRTPSQPQEPQQQPLRAPASRWCPAPSPSTPAQSVIGAASHLASPYESHSLYFNTNGLSSSARENVKRGW